MQGQRGVSKCAGGNSMKVILVAVMIWGGHATPLTLWEFNSATGNNHQRCVDFITSSRIKLTFTPEGGEPIRMPLHCRIGTCNIYGEELSKWFMVNYLVDWKDFEDVRKYQQWQRHNTKLKGTDINKLVSKLMLYRIKKDKLNQK